MKWPTSHAAVCSDAFPSYAVQSTHTAVQHQVKHMASGSILGERRGGEEGLT